jgi:GSH-dependent disulfide-bond oxidoreductase
MIDLFTQGTPNGQKVSIMLEELDLPYSVHLLDFGKAEQKAPEFLAINPNGKIPAIVDQQGPDGDPLAVFESGAILIYLAEKTASELLPSSARARSMTLQWLFWQVGGIGPMFGQAGYFNRFGNVDVPLASERFTKEAHRLLGVLDASLETERFLAGPDYTIADIATWPWIVGADFIGVELQSYAHVARWLQDVGSRETVQRGAAVGRRNP